MIKNTKQNKGFTLVETLVAVTVLATSVASAMSITNKSLQSSLYSRDQTTAVFLAAEGLEMVHNFRDSIAGQNLAKAEDETKIPWLGDLDSKCSIGSNGCNFYADDLSAATQCDTTDGCQLYILEDQDMYTGKEETAYTMPTKFFRKIIVQVNSDWAVVTSIVSWGSNEYSVSESIMNWHKTVNLP